jgi:PadR family transcriptional regulator AphA
LGEKQVDNYLLDIYFSDMSKVDSATDHALLGLLSICPMSGYDMRHMIPESIGHFWSESYGQIYPALKRMAGDGLVEKRTEAQAGRPERHVYTLTEAGRARLEGWLAQPVRREVSRDELLLKLFFGAHAGVGVNRGHVLEFLAEQERALQVFAGMAEELKRDHARDPQLPFWLMTLNRGLHDTRAGVEWARETLAELDRLDLKKTQEAGDGA